MNKYINIIELIEKKKLFKYICIGYLINFISLHLISPKSGIPDLVFFYNSDFITELFQRYTTKDIYNFRIVIILDSLFMIGLSFINSIIFKKFQLRQWIIFLPFMIFPMDLLENTISAILTFSHSQLLFQLLPIASALKWISIILVVLIYPYILKKYLSKSN